LARREGEKLGRNIGQEETKKWRKKMAMRPAFGKQFPCRGMVKSEKLEKEAEMPAKERPALD